MLELSESERSSIRYPCKGNVIQEIRTFKLGELFCGPGGIALGAFDARVFLGSQEFRIQHAWANDYDEDTCETYRLNFCPDSPGTVLCADVKDIEWEVLPPIDALAFGFPCNDFSVVGEHRGVSGVFGPLYQYGVSALEYFHPSFFVAENVGGLASANSGRALREILKALMAAGPKYRLTAHLYKAEHYGVPQTRHRIIIVGIAERFSTVFRVPAPTTPVSYVTAREALEVPPIPSDASNHERTRQAPQVIERLMHTRPGENAWTAELPEYLRLNVKTAHLSQIYKRLDPDKPSYTITGSGGGGTHGYHWSEPRALTNRERARIQTFPDSFRFVGNTNSVRKQIGMAVPPLMAQVIFTAILRTFASVPYASVPANIDVSALCDAGTLSLREIENGAE